MKITLLILSLIVAIMALVLSLNVYSERQEEKQQAIIAKQKATEASILAVKTKKEIMKNDIHPYAIISDDEEINGFVYHSSLGFDYYLTDEQMKEAKFPEKEFKEIRNDREATKKYVESQGYRYKEGEPISRKHRNKKPM